MFFIGNNIDSVRSFWCQFDDICVYSNYKAKKRTVKIKVQGVEPTIKEALNILKEETNDNKLARAFIELMQTSYVLVHVIVNKGNNYKDNVQCKAFCDFLTSEVVDKMKSLEGKDGKRTF